MEPDAVAPDAFLQANVVIPVEAGVASLDMDVLAVSEVPLNGVTDDVRSFETNLGNLVADAFLFSARQRAASFGIGGVDIAIANGGGIRNNNILPAGDFTTLDTFDVLSFLNFLTVVEDITPERFKLMMENSVAAIFSERRAGSGSGRFGQIAGFTVTFNPIGRRATFDVDGSVTFEGDRVESIILDDGTVIVENGEVVPGAPNVNLAIVDFLARGGDQYPLADLPFANLGLTYQQSLAEYVEFLGTISQADYPAGGEDRITNDLLVFPADQNRDNVLTGADYNAWIFNFQAGNGGADLNFDRDLTGADFGAFLDAAGVPAP